MEVIVKPTLDNLEEYIEYGIHSFLLPLKDYSVEYSNNYSLNQIKELRNKYSDIELFISINKNILNSEISKLKDILLELEELNIQGIFYYDLAILKLKQDLKLKTNLVWNQTYMVTNYKTCDYYYNQGVKYALLAKEITKEEIVKIQKESKINVIVELISYPVVAFSKRKLVKNYHQDSGLTPKDKLFITEPKTKQDYIVMEDQNGVSFIQKKLMNGSKILKDLVKEEIPYILLKEDFIDHKVFLEVVENISNYLKDSQTMTEEEWNLWLQKQNKLLGRNTNFFYRKTVYKVK